MVLAVETGMRRGEILGIRWEHFDHERRCLLIPQTKNGHARTIPLSQRAGSILDSIERTEPSAFPISANAFRLSWERVKKKAGIIDLHFHDLRHEAISRFFEMGMTVPEVASLSGHRTLSMLMRYAHAHNQSIQAKLAVVA